ncbi:MAG TPA: HIT domain-containing protein [Phycisphaerae bacterium]|nr:HIT domain-containing protein [Phycisphaerae bacterium]
MSGILWAPWRIEYIKKVSNGPEGCFLCDVAKNPEKDSRQLVVHRSAAGLLMMNLYPYVNGHLLIAPFRHAADLPDLTMEERSGMMELVQYGQKLLAKTMNPQGFNIGVNIGRCAGAGVPGHVHMHIVPRWNGDVNFMSVVGQVRVIPQALEEAYAQLVQEHQRTTR